MLSAGVALQGLAWAESKMAPHTPLEAQLGSVTEHLGSPPQDLFMFLGLPTEFQECTTTQHDFHHIVSPKYIKMNSPKEKEKGSLFVIHHSTKFTISIEEK